MTDRLSNIIAAHKHSSNHRGEIARSETCGCFYCLATFKWSDVVERVDGGNTVLCPECGIDSVVGSASGYPITEEFLKRMNDYWFGR